MAHRFESVAQVRQGLKDVNYLADEGIAGVAFLEAYPQEADLRGDTSGMHPRTTAFYRKIFRAAGLRPCGSHCYVGPPLHGSVTALEYGAL